MSATLLVEFFHGDSEFGDDLLWVIEVNILSSLNCVQAWLEVLYARRQKLQPNMLPVFGEIKYGGGSSSAQLTQ